MLEAMQTVRWLPQLSWSICKRHWCFISTRAVNECWSL